MGWALAAVAMLQSGHAVARDMTGKMGVGMGLSGQGMPLFSIRYWRTHAALEVSVGWTSQKQALAPVSVQAGKALPAKAGQPESSAQSTSACVSAAKEIGAEASSVTNCAATIDLSYLRVAAGVLVRIADSPRASLSFGVRPWLQTTTQTWTESVENVAADNLSRQTTTSPVSTSPASRWGIELPLMAEAFLTDNASIHGQIAVGFTRGRLPEYAGTSIGSRVGPGETWLGTMGSYSGGAGLTYYF